MSLTFDAEENGTAPGAVLDASGNDHHATLGNGDATDAPLWTAEGRYLGAYDFTDDLMTVASDLGDPTALTFALWFKKPQLTEGSEYLVDARTNGNWWLLYDYSSGACTDTGANLCFYAKAEVPAAMLEAGRWHHVAVTANETASKIYLDGSLVDSGAGFDPDLGAGLILGARYAATTSGGFNEFTGAMDEVLIYDRVLNDAEVTALYEGAISWNTDTQSWSGTCGAESQAMRIAPDPCEDMTCADNRYCVGNALYQQPGLCSEGVCGLGNSVLIENCRDGCSNGACNPPPLPSQTCCCRYTNPYSTCSFMETCQSWAPNPAPSYVCE